LKYPTFPVFPNPPEKKGSNVNSFPFSLNCERGGEAKPTTKTLLRSLRPHPSIYVGSNDEQVGLLKAGTEQQFVGKNLLV